MDMVTLNQLLISSLLFRLPTRWSQRINNSRFLLNCFLRRGSLCLWK